MECMNILLFSSINKSCNSTSVTQKVISVFYRSSASKSLYMFICIIQITTGEQQQPTLPQSATRHDKNKFITAVRFVDIGDKVISLKLQRRFTASATAATRQSGRDECKHVLKSRRKNIITINAIIPPWKPANDLTAGSDPHAQASRLIKQTNGN